MATALRGITSAALLCLAIAQPPYGPPSPAPFPPGYEVKYYDQPFE